MTVQAAFYGGAGWLCVWGGGAVREKNKPPPQIEQNTIFGAKAYKSNVRKFRGALFKGRRYSHAYSFFVVLTITVPL